MLYISSDLHPIKLTSRRRTCAVSTQTMTSADPHPSITRSPSGCKRRLSRLDYRGQTLCPAPPQLTLTRRDLASGKLPPHPACRPRDKYTLISSLTRLGTPTERTPSAKTNARGTHHTVLAATPDETVPDRTHEALDSLRQAPHGYYRPGPSGRS
ncbi:hypothetical protein BD413DRAFT_124754 [Trametes elegans]|nr:hypothetical protein BD413DRAFT_124754 [Trametes elegans]